MSEEVFNGEFEETVDAHKQITDYRPIDWGVACGKHYLKVNGFVTVIIMQPCYDADLQARFKSDRWTEEMIKFVAEKQ
jgi:hypothetical protein